MVLNEVSKSNEKVWWNTHLKLNPFVDWEKIDFLGLMRLIITWTAVDIMDFAQIPAALQFQPGLSTNAILQIMLFW